MRTTPLLLAIAIALAFGAGQAVAAGASASGNCNGNSDSASAGTDGVDGPDDPNNVVDAVVALLTGSPADCSGGGHIGASASADGVSAGACTDGDTLYTEHSESGGCSNKVLP